jgi:myo-inositol-1(or 4)-monophosphatase
LVTNVDLEAERKIIDLIRKNYPDHIILSEESKQSKGKSEYRWIIDPLDGTHNYIRGIEIFGVSIALEYKGEVVLGVIYLPSNKQLYFTQKGEGSYLNGQKIKVSQRELKEASMSYDSSLRLDRGNVMLKNLNELTKQVFNVRMFGSTARSLSFVAEGKIDFSVEYHDRPWDFSAGALLVEEAGGRVTDIYGRVWSSRSRGYIASNGILHEEIIQIIN